MKKLRVGLGVLFGLLLAAALFVSLVYIPRQVVHAERYAITQSPADVGVAFEDVTVTPADQPLKLAGWWMPANEPVATLVFIHGGSANRHSSYFHALDFYREMVARRVSVLAIDLRNHGASDGDAQGIRFGLTEKEDARAAIEWARAKAPELPLYAMGVSMGGSTVIYAAADGVALDGLILLDPLLDTESCFSNAVWATVGIPTALLAPSAWSAVTFFGLPPGSDALEAGRRLKLRTLLIQDPSDPVTVAPYARELAALNPNVTFYLAPEPDPGHPELDFKGRWGTHVGAFTLFPEFTLGKIMTFIQAPQRG